MQATPNMANLTRNKSNDISIFYQTQELGLDSHRLLDKSSMPTLQYTQQCRHPQNAFTMLHNHKSCKRLQTEMSSAIQAEIFGSNHGTSTSRVGSDHQRQHCRCSGTRLPKGLSSAQSSIFSSVTIFNLFFLTILIFRTISHGFGRTHLLGLGRGAILNQHSNTQWPDHKQINHTWHDESKHHI